MGLLFEILKNSVLQIIYLIGLFVFTGLLISVCNKLFIRFMGIRAANKVILTTSYIGTPVHELGHAIMCLIFGHKIIEMKLINTDPYSKTLGFVKHSYKKNNIYHKIGNFFIGIGPLFSGILALMLAMAIMVPTVFDKLKEIISDSASGKVIFDVFTFQITFKTITDIFLFFFSLSNITNFFWWLFVILGCCIALHMNFSREDINGSLSGFSALCAFILIVNFIVGFIHLETLYAINRYLLIYNNFILSLMTIILIFSLMLLLFAGIFGLIRVLTLKKRKQARINKLKAEMRKKYNLKAGK